MLGQTVLADEREVILRALGVSRRSVARDFLLARVSEGDLSDARAAVRALAVHAYDPRVVEAVRAAAAQNASVDLGDALATAFPT